MFRKSNVSGAEVRAVSDLGVTGMEHSWKARSDDQGQFRLVLPPGQYHLSYTAAPTGGNPGLYGFFGGNPLSVGPGTPSRVVLRGTEWHGVTRAVDAPQSGIDGRALLDGQPLPRAAVQVFLDGAGRFRGPGYATTTTDGDGRFTFDLPPGRYFLVARGRRGAERIGPLKMGDAHAWYPGNPVYLAQGKRAAVDLHFLEVEKDPSRTLAEASRATLVSGRVISPDGGPVPDIHLCLYPGPEPLGMPRFVSEPSGADGSFSIRAAEGTWYMVARTAIGKPLARGERVGFYRGPDGNRITLKAGEDLTGLAFVWEGK